MSRSTISTFQLFEKFPDEATAREYLEKRLWKNGPQCPKCKGTKNVSVRTGKDGFYMCNLCRFEFSIRHLGRYIDEFTFRLNAGKVQRHVLDRLDSFVDNVVGRRITYEKLTGGAA